MIDYNDIKHTCGNCGNPVNKYASKCPSCGVRLEGRVWAGGKNPFEQKKPLTEKEKRDTILILLIPIIGILIILGILFAF